MEIKEVKSLLDARTAQSNLKWLPPAIVFATRHGSWAYGTNIATSDIDVKGIAIPPAEYYFGFNKVFEQAEFKDPDCVIYEISKFFRLARDSNPNIIEILNTDESDWITVSPLGRKILDHKQDFLSMKAKHTFAGYAHAQLKRINTHYRWLKNPPNAPPTRAEFGLPERPAIDPNQMQAAMTEIQKKIESWDVNWEIVDPAERILMQERLSAMFAEVNLAMEDKFIPAAKSLGFDENFILLIQTEQAYKQKIADWGSYQEWKRSRNPQRSELEAKFGYDTKHGMHLVRLMKMCREIITTGKVNVRRPDAEELLSIRYGAWTYEKLIEWSDQQEKELNELYKTCKVIPHMPDSIKLDALCTEIVMEALGCC